MGRKIMKKHAVFVLPDIHLPWTDWGVLEEARRRFLEFKKQYSRTHKVVVVQLGDLIDGYSWSRFHKAPDGPSAQHEWDLVEEAVIRLHKLFPEMQIIEGNHDVRAMRKALEVMMPRQLLKELDQVFDCPKWVWHVNNEPLQIDGVAYIHGDEISAPSMALKASKMGQSVVTGHSHKASLAFINHFNKEMFGMECGAIVDEKAICFRYAAKSPMRTWVGYATVIDGVHPQLHSLAAFKGRKK